MVKMKNIRRIENVISMDCYAEGLEEGHFYLEIDANTFDIITNTLGEMDSYVFHAVQRIKTLMNERNELPESALSMWC